MKIKNIEVDFNFLDADDIEKFEKEAQKVKEKADSYKNDKEISYSEAIRRECTIIDDFFDNVFGEGTSLKLFNGKKNLEEHIQVFSDIVEEKVKQTKNFAELYQRYTPNRQERRFNKFKRK